MRSRLLQKSQKDLESWLVSKVASLATPTESDDVKTTPFEDLGISSVQRFQLLGELEEYVGSDLPSMLFESAKNISEVSLQVRSILNPEAVKQDRPAYADARDRFNRYVNPTLGERLLSVGLDVEFVAGKGSYLKDSSGREYLDFLAGYGSVPFGHNPKFLWRTISEIEERHEPCFVQASIQGAASELAWRLIRSAPGGLDHVTFSNSGAEAIEVAIKIARAATGKKGILSTHSSFHGKTLGALSATGNFDYQRDFGLPIEHFHKVDFGDITALEKTLDESAATLAAFIVEPIQGEGGVLVPPAGYLTSVAELCSRYDVLLVVDEVQTGLGRTGRLFACSDEGIDPDILVLAKALGGGLLPIGATLCKRAVYSSEFALNHSSTFAGGALASRVGISVLDYLEADDSAFLSTVKANGDYLKNSLLAIAARYPRTISQVRGKGLMLGIELGGGLKSNESIIGLAAKQKLLASLLSGWLLRSERLRTAPTLNASNVMRIQPPLSVSRAECEEACKRLERGIEILDNEDAGTLFQGILNRRRDKPKSFRTTSALGSIANRKTNFDFCMLVHPPSGTEYSQFDRSLTSLGEPELDEIANRLGGVLEPFVAMSCCIESARSTAKGVFVTVPFTATQMNNLPQSETIEAIKKGAEIGVGLGAKIVGLGGYTSIATRGGEALKDCGAPTTTGNALTAVSAVDQMRSALASKSTSLAQSVVSVVGANGIVGQSIALLSILETPKLLLIGSPSRGPERSIHRLKRLAARLCKHLLFMPARKEVVLRGSVAHEILKLGDKLNPASDGAALEYIVSQLIQSGRLVLGTRLERLLPFCDASFFATSSIHNLVEPKIVKPGSVLCDVSRPGNIPRDIEHHCVDVLRINGGVVRAPSGLDLRRFGLAKDEVFACMAETLLLSLERDFQTPASDLKLDLAGLLDLRTKSISHGFRSVGA